MHISEASNAFATASHQRTRTVQLQSSIMSFNEHHQDASRPEPRCGNADALNALRENDTMRQSDLKRKIYFFIKAMLSLIILSMFLSLGRQLIDLYFPGEQKLIDRASFLTAFGESSADLIDIQFGDQPVGLQCSSFVGNRDSVILRLKDLCRVATQQSSLPADLPSEEEQRVIRSLLDQDNDIESSDEKFIVRSINGIDAMPAVVGIRKVPASAKSVANDEHAEMRTVAWGFATQKSNDEWSIQIITKHPGNISSLEPFSILLPAGSQKIMQMSLRDGNSIIAFENMHPVATQMTFFDNHCASKGWVKDDDWRVTDRGSTAVYRKAENNNEYALDIHLRPSAKKQRPHSGSTQGIISIDFRF